MSLAKHRTVRVLVLSRYGRLGASSRVRFYQYLPYLKTYGIEATTAPLFTDQYVRELYSRKGRSKWGIVSSYIRRVIRMATSSGYDLFWIEKELLPWLPVWCEALLARSRKAYVVDFDDAVFHNYNQHSSRWVRGVLGAKFRAVMRNARIVLAGNSYLAAYARSARAKEVVELPSVVDLNRYSVVAPCPEDVFRIGWMGTPVTAPYLSLVRDAMIELSKKRPIRFIAVGLNFRDLDEIGLGPVATEARPWSEETEVAEIQSFDVGIMPLSESEVTRGKCGYKLIQYMGCGRPAIASPIGANADIVADGVDGFLASSTSDWVSVLDALASQPALREKLGKAARHKVEANFSVQGVVPRLASLLRKASDV